MTIAPIGWPSRSLKVAIDFLALVTTGFWPVIARSSSTAESMILGFVDRLAEAHVDDDLLQARHLHRVRVAELLHQRGDDLVVVELAQAGRSGALDALGGASATACAAFALASCRAFAAFLALGLGAGRLLGGHLGLLLAASSSGLPLLPLIFFFV